MSYMSLILPLLGTTIHLVLSTCIRSLTLFSIPFSYRLLAKNIGTSLPISHHTSTTQWIWSKLIGMMKIGALLVVYFLSVFWLCFLCYERICMNLSIHMLCPVGVQKRMRECRKHIPFLLCKYFETCINDFIIDESAFGDKFLEISSFDHCHLGLS